MTPQEQAMWEFIKEHVCLDVIQDNWRHNVTVRLYLYDQETQTLDMLARETFNVGEDNPCN